MHETATKKGVIQHVEAEIYAYPYCKKEIQRLREEILAPFDDDPIDQTIVSGKNSARIPGDPTGRLAIKLAGHSRLLHLERVCDAIERAYSRLPEPKQELVQLKYWTKPQRLTTIGICEKLGISERTYRRWRNEFVDNIAEILGWK